MRSHGCERTQARGRALLNLRVVDVEGGLLGRTLLTLVSNRGYLAGSKAAAQPELPPHKFSPHDIVAVKPNKGPGEVPPLCTGEHRDFSERVGRGVWPV